MGSALFSLWGWTMNYLAIIDIRARGIPALAGLTSYHYQAPGTGSPCAYDSDWDYLGWEEIEWDLLDRHGRPAPWLSRRLSRQDRADIERQVSAAMAKRRQVGDL